VSIRGKAFIAGAYEHPLREIPDRSLAKIHAEVAIGALEDAGLTLDDVDGYFCAGDAPGFGPMSMADYLGLNKLSYVDSTETGGSSYNTHVGHAASAIVAGKCTVALVTLAGQPRAAGTRVLGGGRPGGGPGGPPNPVAVLGSAPESGFEGLYGPNVLGMYALAATRHMYEFGTTSEQLAWIKVAASRHAQHNPNAILPYAVTVDDVLNSPMVSDPLHRLDCCVITDGGGAVVVVSAEIAKSLKRTCVKVLGHGESPKHTMNGRIDLTYTGAVWSGPRAFAEAGVEPKDVNYASIYDSFTITVLETIEDLGFCEKGKGGPFVADGGLVAPDGRLPFNTDGGGLCNNHPANRGGMTKTIETVRQLRGEAHPAVQVPNCTIGVAHGNGGSLGTRSGAATLVLGTEDA
jgi:acetyl-CoA C-acetyltransferase